MYTSLLIIHSWLRWVILILAVINIYKSFTGFKKVSPYSRIDNVFAGSFTGIMHLMFLIGLGLYFTSPFAYAAFGGSESVMKNTMLRYWAVEHVFMMISALVVATIGRAKSKKKTSDPEKFKTQLIYFSIALVLMISRIPWREASRIFRLE